MPAAATSQGEGRKGSPLQLLGEYGPANTSILNFQLPELGDSTFLLS